MSKHETTIDVRYYETDGQGVVHHANYFKYFEIARVDQLAARGHDYAQLERDGVILVVSKIACKYHRPAKFGDQLKIQLETTRARGARIDHVYQVTCNGQLLAEGESTIACIDKEGQVCRLPDFLMGDDG